MYVQYFHLAALPFENTPDPAFFFSGEQYRETLAVMLHCLNNRKGILALSGPIGVGKTTISQAVRRFVPDRTRIVNLIHPKVTTDELLSAIARAIDVTDLPFSHIEAVELVRDRLVQLNDDEDGRCLLVIDEAQLLGQDILEELRLLSNLETAKSKLLQVFLVGQPELMDILNRPNQAPLRQRIAMFKQLTPLSTKQVVAYIHHRLKAAGGSADLFTAEALGEIVEFSQGIPRVINQLCDGALINAFGRDQSLVGAIDVAETSKMLNLALPARKQPAPTDQPTRPEQATAPSADQGSERPDRRSVPPADFQRPSPQRPPDRDPAGQPAVPPRPAPEREARSAPPDRRTDRPEEPNYDPSDNRPAGAPPDPAEYSRPERGSGPESTDPSSRSDGPFRVQSFESRRRQPEPEPDEEEVEERRESGSTGLHLGWRLPIALLLISLAALGLTLGLYFSSQMSSGDLHPNSPQVREQPSGQPGANR